MINQSHKSHVSKINNSNWESQFCVYDKAKIKKKIHPRKKEKTDQINAQSIKNTFKSFLIIKA